MSLRHHFSCVFSRCDNDYLTVHDGKNSRSKEIGKFCGNATVELISSHRYLFLEFSSNSHRQAKGFTITYDFIQASGNNSTLSERHRLHRCAWMMMSLSTTRALPSIRWISYRSTLRDGVGWGGVNSIGEKMWNTPSFICVFCHTSLFFITIRSWPMWFRFLLHYDISYVSLSSKLRCRDSRTRDCCYHVDLTLVN